MPDVCPWWMGYLLVNPLRRLMENPRQMLSPYISPGDMVLEPGSGMGYFTLCAADLVGENGRVVAVDIQEKMLAGLRRRARKAGLADRIDTRLVGKNGMDIDDLAGRVDLALAIHMVHEVPDQAAFFGQVARALAPGGRLLFVEPKGHVNKDKFAQSLDLAARAGLTPSGQEGPVTLSALLRKSAG